MATSGENKGENPLGRIIQRTWTDEAFKRRFLADPAAVLKEAGIEVPAGITFKVVENSPTVHHIVLPPRPTRRLSDEELSQVAGGLEHCGTCDLLKIPDTRCGPNPR